MSENSGKIYNFRPRPRPNWGRGRGRLGIHESYSTYAPDINEQVGENIPQSSVSFDQFEDVDTSTGEYSGSQITSGDGKSTDVRNHNQMDTDVEELQNYESNQITVPKTINQQVGSSNTDRYEEMRRELEETKRKLAEKDHKLAQRDHEIIEIRQKHQRELSNAKNEYYVASHDRQVGNQTEAHLTYTSDFNNEYQQPARYAYNSQHVYRDPQIHLNTTEVHEYDHGALYQQPTRYSSSEQYNYTSPQVTQAPNPIPYQTRSTCSGTQNDEPKFRLPYFTGKNQFEGFWTVFELGICKFNWNNQAQLENLWCCLKDEALDFACKLPTDIQNNIFRFRDALKRRYGDNRLPEQYREDLVNIKKHFKESLPEYAARVENLVCKGYPQLQEQDLLNTIKVENFLKGIHDQNIAYEVKIRKPCNIDEAIELYNWHECCKGGVFKKRADIRQLELDGDGSVEDLDIRKVNGGKQQYVTMQAFNKFEQEVKSQVSDIVKALNKGNTSSSKRNYTNLTCFICHEKGHISKYCTKKKTIGGQDKGSNSPVQGNIKQGEEESN